MKSFLLKLFLVFISFLLIDSTNNIFAQQKLSAFEQLESVNALWKVQTDIDPQLVCNPAREITEQQLIQFHLQQTELLLRKRKPQGLTELQKKNRQANLDVLHTYWQTGVFPVNDKHIGRQPYFIDKFNTYCAVGYLMQQSGADAIARDINLTQNYNYLGDIVHPELMNWVFNSGLSLDELALIQPAYIGDWGCAITELHYNNTGADVDEYIEVHQSNYPFNPSLNRFTSILFYDHLNVLYKTMQINEMQLFSVPGDSFYYYLFPANESLADSGRIEILNNASAIVFAFDYNASGIMQEEHNPTDLSIINYRHFTTIEDNSTPVGSSLTFCGRYNISGGPDMWQPSIIPATIGIANPCMVLAVNLTTFSYIANAKTVQLKWQTATESNSDYFIVERSSDGINFSPVGRVKAAGTSNTTKYYELPDNNPGYLNHYRLKLVNFDGSFSYSQILYVKFAAANPIRITSNPVNNTLSIQINSVVEQAGNLLIYDFHGKKMLQLKAKPGKQDINLSVFSSGKYMVQLQTADGRTYNQPFIKQ